MTSKEALERISWRYVNEPSFQEWCDIVKQELERLEVLENYPPEFDGFLYSFEGLIERNKKLEKENQELKELNEKYLSELERWGYPETPIHISKYKKLKKAIEILKNNIFIEFNDDSQFISLKENEYQYADYTIIFIENKQKYKLLKEVLEDGKSNLWNWN